MKAKKPKSKVPSEPNSAPELTDASKERIDKAVLKQIADLDANGRRNLVKVYQRWIDTIRQNLIDDAPRQPAMCDAELEEIAAQWGPEKRKSLGEKFSRWGRQLCFSADMLERFGKNLGEEPELAIPSYELADWLRNKTRAQCLAEAAKFEEWCATIRQMLGVKNPVTTQPTHVANFN